MADNRVDSYTTKTGAPNDYDSPTGVATERSITRYYDGSKTRIERLLRDGTLEIYKERDTSNPYTNWYFLSEVQHRDSANTITVAFDSVHRPVTITDTRGQEFHLDYTDAGRLTSFDSNGRTWTLSYTSDDLTGVTAPGSRTTTFTYTGSHLLESIKAPREGSGGTAYLTNTYSGSAPYRVTQQALGSGTFYLSYGSNVCTETDREGGHRIVQWNDSSQITKIRQETSTGNYADTSIAWNGDGLPSSITYPEGNGVQMRYDATRHLTASIRCNASGIGSSDTPGNMRSSSNFLVTEYTYTTGTNWDLVTNIKDPMGNDWALSRNSLGNVTSYTTPQHPNDPYVISYD
jgi:YD repeat-containing protein